MSAHDDHKAMKGYDERQILVDGCKKCEQRSSDCLNTLGWMDGRTFAKAWNRAYVWQYHDPGPEELGRLSDVELPVLHMLWAIQVMLERTCRIPLGTLPAPVSDGERELFGDILVEATRLSVVASKAEGLVRTSNHKRGDDLRVVQQWWDALVEAVGMGPCEEGRCGPLIDGTDEEYDVSVMTPPPGLPPYQYGYCEKCHRPYRWDVPTQRLVPLDLKGEGE